MRRSGATSCATSDVAQDNDKSKADARSGDRMRGLWRGDRLESTKAPAGPYGPELVLGRDHGVKA